jgi:hypothetical protein
VLVPFVTFYQSFGFIKGEGKSEKKKKKNIKKSAIYKNDTVNIRVNQSKSTSFVAMATIIHSIGFLMIVLISFFNETNANKKIYK